MRTFITQAKGHAERYLKTDVGYLARGGFWLGLSQVISALAGLALVVAFANLLPKETYGIYRFVLAAAGVLALTNLSGINVALARAVAQSAYQTYLPAFFERVRWGCLGALGALAAALYYSIAGDTVLAAAFLIAAAFLPFSDPLNVYEAYRQGLKDFRYRALADIAVRVLSAGALVAALVATDSVLVLIAVYFLSYSLMQALFFFHTLKDARSRASAGTAGTGLYGKHLSVMYIVSSFAAQADKLIVFHVGGAAVLAANSLAILIPDQIRTSMKNIAVLAIPKYAADSFEGVKRGLARKNLQIGLATVALAGAYVLAAPYIFSILFPAYSEAVLLTQLLALGLIDTLTLLPLSMLKAHQKTRELYHYHIITSMVQVALLFAGGLFYGVYGLIAGFVVSRAIAVAHIGLLTRR